MSSSTSSSEAIEVTAVVPRVAPPVGPRRWRAWLAPVFALVVLEIAVRLVFIPASRDLSRFHGYPARAKRLVERPGLHVALIGNSVTDVGVDLARFERSLSVAVGRPVAADMLVADGADISTDYWITERWLWKADLRPDLLVVTWFGADIEDNEPRDLGRLARFLVPPDEWRELFDCCVRSLGDRVEFVVSAASAAFATRHRIKRRVLMLVPGYEDAITRVNDANFEDQQTRLRPHPATFHMLERFLARARAHGVSVCFVAYPSRRRYEVPDEAVRLIAAAGMSYIDLRRVVELTPQHYLDHAHLNESGRPIYTDALTRALAAVWRP